jgi:hypothetical protein
MPTNIDYSDHAKVLVLIQEAQDNERDQRARVEEAQLFITEKDGQWDRYAISKMDGRFRGTFDMCTPIVDGIAGEITQSDFSIRVSPANGVATKQIAKTYDGLIRNIRNVSNADTLFNDMGRTNVVGGFDACEVVQDFIEPDSFNQGLLIKKIANAVRSVWWDQGSIEQDRHDADWGIKLKTIQKSEYDERWSKGSGVSIGDNAVNQTVKNTTNATDTVTIGKLYYKKPLNIEIVQMTDGSVYKDDEKFKSIQDELSQPTEDAPEGIKIETDDDGKEKRRKVKQWRVWTRLLDGSDWLDVEEETVFDYIPLVPIYGNFTIIDDKYIYFGKLQNLFDQQRVLNYSTSRDIEDGALGPSEKIAMTTDQIGNNDYSKINTERDPIFEYDNDEKSKSPPYKMAGAQPNAALQTTISNMQQMMNSSSNTFQAQQGNAPSTQSGIAGMQQIEQANIGSIKWFTPLEVMICQIGRIIVNSAPRVYDGTRLERILEEDGNSNFVELNKKIFDDETKKNIVINDLSLGQYDSVCESGPAFNSSQKEAARAIETIMTINPQLAAENMDIYLKNKKEPGFDLMAEREREKIFNAGLIPESQWTDEEKQQVADQQAAAEGQPPQEDPALKEANGIEMSGQADLTNANTKQQEAQFNAQVKAAQVAVDQDKVALEREKLQFDVQKFLKGQDDKFNVDAATIQLNVEKQDLAQRKQEFDEFIVVSKQQFEQQQQAVNDAINNLKTIQDASGDTTIIGPGLVDNMKTQSDIVSDKQDESD